MRPNQLIELLEKATGQALNEADLDRMVDTQIRKALAPVAAKEVRLDGGTAAEGPGFSRFLGDVRRLGMGQAPLHLADDQMVRLAPSMQQISPSRVKDLREGATAAGGYLVPTEQAGEVLTLVNKYSAVKGLCREVPMRAKQITFPTITQGVTAYWVPEATDTATYGLGDGQQYGETPRSDAAFGQLPITAHVLAVKVVVSNQLLDDSDPGVDGVLRALFAETIGAAFDVACLRGAGTATDPIGGLAGAVTTNAL